MYMYMIDNVYTLGITIEFWKTLQYTRYRYNVVASQHAARLELFSSKRWDIHYEFITIITLQYE